MNPSGASESIKALADKYIFPTYKRSLALIRGQGCRVWDDHGREYLDFVGGIAVCALGHSSPIVTKALEEQAGELVHVSNLYYTRPQAELAALLVGNSFADRVFFCNSGAEANEAAIKLARKYAREKQGPGRSTIICMEGSFHGRTIATLSATGQTKVQAGYEPLLSGFRFVPFNDFEAVKSAADDSVCAVLLEPIQGEGGVVVPHGDYLKKLREFCFEKRLLLILDEIQTGMGRTGRLFAHEHFGVAPDIMTLAKALGNGLPIGAMLGTEELSTVFGPGSHASTFGGTPLVASVSKAVVTSILEDGWLDHCRRTGEYFRQRLEGLMKNHPCVREVRGLGLIVGLELDRPAAPIVEACLQKGFLINAAQEKVLRFVPPLIVGAAEIDRLIEVLDEVLNG
jgi:acetylornithine/N-succinyldiaminopimelate aminotransferase